jgi:hypothetical protein
MLNTIRNRLTYANIMGTLAVFLVLGGTAVAGRAGTPEGPSLKVRAETSGTGAVTASCRPGEVATGGGAHSFGGRVLGQGPTSNPLAFFTSTGVTFQGYTPTAWSAVAKDASGDPADVTAWVVCASAPR